MKWTRRDIGKNTLIAAPAFALALAACGGGAAGVSSGAASPSELVVADVENDTTDTASADATITSADAMTTSSSGDTDPSGESSSRDGSVPSTEASAIPRNTIQKLSADEAIANAEVNQANLAPAENVLDIETLAVADGSIQTLRDVVDGDRPVLLWFFSPH